MPNDGTSTPDWLDPDDLADFLAHRKELKKPMTQRAVALLIRRLGKLRDQGYSPSLLLENAILHGWLAPYPHDDALALDAVTRKPNVHPATAPILNYLNERTGRSFRHEPANLKLIDDRITSHGIREVVAVIESRTAQWLEDDKMSSFLRPSTLFNESNFANYLGDISETNIATRELPDSLKEFAA